VGVSNVGVCFPVPVCIPVRFTSAPGPRHEQVARDHGVDCTSRVRRLCRFGGRGEILWMALNCSTEPP